MSIERGNKPRRRKNTGLVYGVGINDAEYQTREVESYTEGGKTKWRIVWSCPIYDKWVGILQRCYSTKFQQQRPTCKDCSIDEHWLRFSNFKRWVETQPSIDLTKAEIDKDLLFPRNKKYSPNTAVLVSQEVNSFLIGRTSSKGQYMLGVCWNKRCKKYYSQCSNSSPKRGRRSGYLGLFDTELEAHLAWKARKHELANLLADRQTDPRVADALRARYDINSDWTYL